MSNVPNDWFEGLNKQETTRNKTETAKPQKTLLLDHLSRRVLGERENEGNNQRDCKKV